MDKAINNYPVQSYSMEYKIGMALLNWIGIPTTILGIVVNWNEIKGWALFCLSLLFLCIRVVFYIDERLDARKIRKVEHEMKELELKKKTRDYHKEDDNEHHY